jgi:hypothetical protein
MADKHPGGESGRSVNPSGKTPDAEIGNNLEETCRQWFGEATWAAMSEAAKAQARKLVAGDDL